MHETGPSSFHLDIFIDSDNLMEEQLALVKAAKKGRFIEQTLARQNTLAHRLKAEDGWLEA